jgi:hypothetical protein
MKFRIILIMTFGGKFSANMLSGWFIRLKMTHTTMAISAGFLKSENFMLCLLFAHI